MRCIIVGLILILGLLGVITYVSLTKYETVERMEGRIAGQIPTRDISQLWFSPGGELVGVGQAGSRLTVRVWSRERGQLVRERSVNLPPVISPAKPVFSVAPDAARLAWVASEGVRVESLISPVPG